MANAIEVIRDNIKYLKKQIEIVKLHKIQTKLYDGTWRTAAPRTFNKVKKKTIHTKFNLCVFVCVYVCVAFCLFTVGSMYSCCNDYTII